MHNGGGHPDVGGAIDGTLFPINRPDNFEGFYCRKGTILALKCSWIILIDSLQGILLTTCRQLSISRSVSWIIPSGRDRSMTK